MNKYYKVEFIQDEVLLFAKLLFREEKLLMYFDPARLDDEFRYDWIMELYRDEAKNFLKWCYSNGCISKSDSVNGNCTIVRITEEYSGNGFDKDAIFE